MKTKKATFREIKADASLLIKFYFQTCSLIPRTIDCADLTCVRVGSVGETGGYHFLTTAIHQHEYVWVLGTLSI